MATGGARPWALQDEFAFQFRPEMAVGGYPRDDGTVEFYQRVLAVLPDGAVVLDLGAGRGASFEIDRGPWKNWLVRLGRRYSRRVGADVDPAVLNNPGLDEAKIIVPGKPLPFADQAFDLILCDWVLEHVSDPAEFASELRRVLKVGGWFCARTPNKWSYFSLAARIVPHGAQDALLRSVQQDRKDMDVFAKYYKMNSSGDVAKTFGDEYWEVVTYTHNPTPAYHAGSRIVFRMISFWQSIVPRSMQTVILVFARRVR